MTTRIPRYPVGHLTDPGHRACNNIQGNQYAHRHGIKHVDNDWQPGANTHWPQPRHEGYLPKDDHRTWSDLTPAQIASLRTPDGYGVRTMEQAFRDAKRYGQSVEVDAKFQCTADDCHRLADLARKVFGEEWQQRVIVKTLTTLPGGYAAASQRLHAAHAAGFTTLLLLRGPDRARRVDVAWIDFTRGGTRTSTTPSTPPKETPVNRLPDNLPAILRSHGLKVVEIDGWQTRGRPASSGPFNPIGILCHHTATGKDWPVQKVINLLVNGRSDLAGPLVQLGLGRDGTVYVIAAGRSNHAGKTRASGPIPAGDGNTLLVGIEAFNDGVGEPWPKVQIDAYVLLCAVLAAKVVHCSAEAVRAHRETSVTGKIDPTGIDMPQHRAAAAATMRRLDAPASIPLSNDPDLVAADRALQHARDKRKPSTLRTKIIDALRAVRTARRTK